MPFDALLCATDLSARSAPALQAAAALASKLDVQRLVLVHVLDPAVRELDGPGLDAIPARAQRRLRALADQLAGQARRPVVERLLEGSVAATLARAAAEEPNALLIVAAGVEGTPTPLGATAERLVDAVSTPVLLVRDGERFAAWAEGRRALKVVLGVDDAFQTKETVRVTRELTARGGAAVDVVYAWYTWEAARRYGVPMVSAVEASPEMQQLVARDLQRVVGEMAGAAITLHPRLGFGRLGDAALDVAGTTDADLVIVGTHDRRSLVGATGSASSIALHAGATSVLAVPGGPARAPERLPPLRHVLVATDLSPFSAEAVGYACAMLAGGGEVSLVHVASDGADRDRLRAQVEALLPRGDGVRGEARVLVGGDPATTICQEAERLGVDAVCIASHGRSGIVRTVLGSVAERVLRVSRRPVFVVRPVLSPLL